MYFNECVNSVNWQIKQLWNMKVSMLSSKICKNEHSLHEII